MTDEDSAARWLHSTVLRLFPDSKYALGYRRRAPDHSGDVTRQARGPLGRKRCGSGVLALALHAAGSSNPSLP